MKQNASLSTVQEIMTEFADRTGLTSEKPPQRYLWTDAFAVCNFLELYRQTDDTTHLELARRLIQQVHHVLGRHRQDDPRTGWLSGFEEKGGNEHPTKGGLRIGKKLPERKKDEPFDNRLEWDRDGQYYHYLTKWMHALNRAGQVSGDLTYNLWALELAQTAHAAFVYTPPSTRQKRMYWKMSIDLSYPLVPSMGQHDPLDGYIIYHELLAAADKGRSEWPDLRDEIADTAEMCEGKRWTTDDPLGLGGLLSDAYRVAQLAIHDGFKQSDLLLSLLEDSLPGLTSYVRKNPLSMLAKYRLAFRELGLSIGLHAIEALQALIEQNRDQFRRPGLIVERLEALRQYNPLAQTIEAFWLEPANREAGSWTEHRDINEVMLATSLAPDGYLSL